MLTLTWRLIKEEIRATINKAITVEVVKMVATVAPVAARTVTTQAITTIKAAIARA